MRCAINEFPEAGRSQGIALRDGKPRALLLLNWRDPWHPKQGGAEHLTLRVLERLAASGWIVEWFSSWYPGAAAREQRDGITYVRAGSVATVHLEAMRRYCLRTDLDAVVDQINTIPFFTPFYRARSIAWFQQLAREVWLYEGGFLGPFGYAAEPLYLAPYARMPLITISHSSAQTLRGIGLYGPVRILPMAVDEPAEADVPLKAPSRDILVVGRLTPSKRVEESLSAAALLRAAGWRGELRVVGCGPPGYRAALERRARKLGLDGKVVFTGHVDDAERGRLFREASALWMTSAREGWGLVVTEAARHGTPSVVYDVPGLRDAVADGETGLVVRPEPQALAAATLALFARFDRFAPRALECARVLGWDATAEAFASAVNELLPPRTTPSRLTRSKAVFVGLS